MKKHIKQEQNPAANRAIKNLKKDYEKNENPLTIWRVYEICRECQIPIPEWVCGKFDLWCRNLLSITTPDKKAWQLVYQALDFKKGIAWGNEQIHFNYAFKVSLLLDQELHHIMEKYPKFPAQLKRDVFDFFYGDNIKKNECKIFIEDIKRFVSPQENQEQFYKDVQKISLARIYKNVAEESHVTSQTVRNAWRKHKDHLVEGGWVEESSK
jgi:hypothetical protein